MNDIEIGEVYYIEIPTGSKAYFRYDREHGTVEYDGKSVTIPERMLLDFPHTAETVGLKAGRVGAWT